jgi:hypothetical protein
VTVILKGILRHRLEFDTFDAIMAQTEAGAAPVMRLRKATFGLWEVLFQRRGFPIIRKHGDAPFQTFLKRRAGTRHDLVPRATEKRLSGRARVR